MIAVVVEPIILPAVITAPAEVKHPVAIAIRPGNQVDYFSGIVTTIAVGIVHGEVVCIGNHDGCGITVHGKEFLHQGQPGTLRTCMKRTGPWPLQIGIAEAVGWRSWPWHIGSSGIVNHTVRAPPLQTPIPPLAPCQSVFIPQLMIAAGRIGTIREKITAPVGESFWFGRHQFGIHAG